MWNVIVLAGAGVRPAGDVVLTDVAREDASVILTRLRELGLEADGSIAIETVDTAISDGARAAVEAARGEQSDAVVWEQVEAQTSERATLSWGFLAFMVLATAIAAAGIFTDSPILIVGAMVLGPEFGPLAGICVAAVQRRPTLVRASLTALLVGIALAGATTYLLSEALIAGGLEPEQFSLDQGLARLISSPDAYTVLVAACAGVAGMLSLTTAKSGALIGVLVSVTTIPAISELGVAAAESEIPRRPPQRDRRGDQDRRGLPLLRQVPVRHRPRRHLHRRQLDVPQPRQPRRDRGPGSARVLHPISRLGLHRATRRQHAVQRHPQGRGLTRRTGPAQPGVSIQRTTRPLLNSWYAGGEGGGSRDRRLITAPGPCRCPSAAAVQWTSRSSRRSSRVQSRRSIVARTFPTARTCSAMPPRMLRRSGALVARSGRRIQSLGAACRRGLADCARTALAPMHADRDAFRNVSGGSPGRKLLPPFALLT